MTTSGTYTFSVNRDDIIRLAMLSIGKLDELETPTSQETTDCSYFLNMIVKQWQGKADFAPGLKTWMRRHGHLFLSRTTGQYTVGPSGTGWTNSYVSTTTTAAGAAGQAVVACATVTGMTAGDRFGVVSGSALVWYTILSIASLNVTLTSNLTTAVSSGAVVFAYTTAAQQPIVIETAMLRDINKNDTPVRIIRDVQTYDALPSKANTSYLSDPGAIYYEFQLTDGTLYTDVAASSDVTKHLAITYLEAAQDFVSANDTPEYPQEWYLALAWELARQICPMFQADWTQIMEMNAVKSLAIAQRKEPEIQTMYFQSGE